jgi:pimeloyl-ACP methyl ester carboxylesterase
LDVFIGGGGDSVSRIVASYHEAFAAAHPRRMTLYFRRSMRLAALAAIRAAAAAKPGERIHLIGHSYGGAVATWLSRQLARDGIDVDLLVTIDPVSRAWTRLPGVARRWINVNARPPGFNGFDGDAWALLGGKWGDWPRTVGSECYDAPFHHNQFGALLEYRPVDAPGALQVLLKTPRGRRSR